MLKPHKGDPKFDAVDTREDDAVFEKRFGTIPDTVRKLGSGPHLNIFKSNVKLLDDFRIRYRRELHEYGGNPKMAVLNPGRHVEIQFVFKNAEVFGLVETEAEADAMEALGIPTKKCNPETHLMEERVDVMFAFYDEDAEATRKFVKNIASGGLLLCRGTMAKELLEDSSTFKPMGTLQKTAGAPQIEKSRRKDYWEHRVGSDAAFKAAKIPHGSATASYDEAIAALKAAGKPTGKKTHHVLENYKRLVEEAMADSGSAADEESGTISYKNAEMENAIELKTELPFGAVDDRIIFVLKKRKMGVS